MTNTATAVAAATYAIDAKHSEVAFEVRHLLSKVRGRFAAFEGAIEFDAAHPELASATFTMQTASVDTNEAGRDAHLRSADFFDADAHPTITFRSTSVRPRRDGRFDVTGDLTIRGITKSVTADVTFGGAAKDPWGNERVAFEGEVRVNRKDFGLNWNAALETGGFLVGDEVKIVVTAQGVRS